MITLIDATIENFRSIVGQPLQVQFSHFTVLVGPNNSGKSNIFRALNMFFHEGLTSRIYSPAIDLPKYTGLGNRAQTRITVTVSFEPSRDTKIEKALAESGQTRLAENRLRLRLEYTRQGLPQWRFISTAGSRSVRAAYIQPLVAALQDSVNFKYIPVGRDILTTIRTELRDELVRTVFRGWSGAVKARQEINEAIDNLLQKLQPQLAHSGEEITRAMASVFSEVQRLELKLPFHDLETMLPSLEPAVDDAYETSLDTKGSGVQTSSLLFFLKYLADHYPQRHNARITYIWAIEEPESYLHPSRQKAIAQVLRDFADEVQTVISTHSPHFVPRSSEPMVWLIDKQDGAPFNTHVYESTYEHARQLLGVSLLDSMYVYDHNVVVEGPSDEIILSGAWHALFRDGHTSSDPDRVRFFPGGNASGACTLFESMRRFGDASEVDIVLVVDGDEAGQKALDSLEKRSGSELELQSNRDYFQLPRDVEWLTSERVIALLEEERPGQIAVRRNTHGDITKFVIHDGHKQKVARRIIEISRFDDLEGHLKLIRTIEESLQE